MPAARLPTVQEGAAERIVAVGCEYEVYGRQNCIDVQFEVGAELLTMKVDVWVEVVRKELLIKR